MEVEEGGFEVTLLPFMRGHEISAAMVHSRGLAILDQEAIFVETVGAVTSHPFDQTNLNRIFEIEDQSLLVIFHRESLHLEDLRRLNGLRFGTDRHFVPESSADGWQEFLQRLEAGDLQKLVGRDHSGHCPVVPQ